MSSRGGGAGKLDICSCVGLIFAASTSAGCVAGEECERPRGTFCALSTQSALDLTVSFEDGGGGLRASVREETSGAQGECEVEQVGCSLVGSCSFPSAPCDACGIAIVVMDDDELYVDVQLGGGSDGVETVVSACDG